LGSNWNYRFEKYRLNWGLEAKCIAIAQKNQNKRRKYSLKSTPALVKRKTPEKHNMNKNTFRKSIGYDALLPLNK